MSDSNATPQIRDFDVQDLAAKHNISVEAAKELIEKVGTDRGSADAAAQDLKLGNDVDPAHSQS